MAYFPMFIDITNKDCLIIGGGEVAYRKVKVLLDFDAKVTLIAKEISSKIRTVANENNNLVVEERLFQDPDLHGKKLVVVATDDNEFNSLVSKKCEDANIPVNVVDDQEKCSFIFSSYVKEGDLVGAFSSSGKSPVLTQYLRDKEKETITPELGEINDLMGELRNELIKSIPDESKRKVVFRKMLEYALENDRLPTEKEIEVLVDERV